MYSFRYCGAVKIIFCILDSQDAGQSAGKTLKIYEQSKLVK